MLLVTNFFRVFALAFPTAPVILTLVGIILVVTFVALNKSQKIQQRAFVKKVKKVKEKQKAYKEEKDNNKLQSRVKDYDKAMKKLRKRISRALWWNKKKIVLSNPILTSGVDEKSDSDLSISGKPFAFKDVLNEMINSKKKENKKSTQVILKNQSVKQLKSQPIVKKLSEPKKKIETMKTYKQVTENNNLDSIYKSNTNEKIQ